ncbi:MAG: cyclic nucleotide-binding/CBS domain-containing protein [Nitrososphaerales archaeon]
MSGALRVRDIINRQIAKLGDDASVKEAADLMLTNNIGAILVERKGRSLGIVTERDVVKKIVAAGLRPESTKLRDVMSSPLVAIDSNASIGEAVQLMLRKKVRRLVATDGKDIVGIFTERDIVGSFWTCTWCHKRIRRSSLLAPKEKSEHYVRCSCGSRYHSACAKQIVHCHECNTPLIEMVYPDPEDTLAG